MDFTWKEIAGTGVLLVLVAIAATQLPMFKTERQKEDALLTPGQQKKIAAMDTICRGGTAVGADQLITPEQRDTACLMSRQVRQVVSGQATIRTNPNWNRELELEVKKAADRHRECEQRVRRIEIDNEAARARGQAIRNQAAVDTRYGFCDREYNIAVFSANLKYGVKVPEKSVRE